MKRLVLIAYLLMCGTANADDLTLNDLPGVLLKLRGCTETKPGWVTSAQTICLTSKDDLWVAIHGDGAMTLFRKRSYGDTTYAYGKTVNELLRDFASKINNDQQTNKDMLEALAPYLPTQ